MDASFNFDDDDEAIFDSLLLNTSVNLSPGLCTNNEKSVEEHSSPQPQQATSSMPVEVDDRPPKSQKNPRSVYLITYSQADILKVPSRERFGEIIAAEFNRSNDDIVKHWVSAAELHAKGGIHYHCAIKLKCPRRWSQVRNNLSSKYKIEVDFTEWHDMYHDAFSYVIKQDAHYVTSPGHINLDNNPPPRTAAAVKGKRLACQRNIKFEGNQQATKKKQPRLDNTQIFNIIVANNVKSDKKLCALAKLQMKEGKHDLHRWVMNHPNSKNRQDIIETAWSIESSEADLEREEKSLIDILAEALEGDCREDPETGFKCNRKWLPAALQVLRKNNIQPEYFAKVVAAALQHGRGKGRNVMIIGDTNCAKSFMFLPLMHMFTCFTCPSGSAFNFVGAHEKEVLLFNDIRYEANGKGDKEFLPWKSFLNLLEGAPINIPMPKNHFASDVQWTKRQPVFATSDRKIIRIINNKMDMGETAQMDERWVYLKFNYQWQANEIDYNLVHCPRCFAELITSYGQ